MLLSQPCFALRLTHEFSREHFTVLGCVRQTVAVDNPWYSGQAEVVTYSLEELLGMKLRAFYQRKKGRDLFDLSVALSRRPDLDCAKVVDCFQRYMEAAGDRVSRAQFEANLDGKLADAAFHSDIRPPLAATGGAVGAFDVVDAAQAVLTRFIALKPGEPRRGRS